jgi:hypothetical protein
MGGTVAEFLRAPQGKYPTGPYQWMRDWTAKVDLTLQTDDTGGITPGASFITPLHSATLTGIGTFQRMFAIGAGGGLNTSASRTETLSFTLAGEGRHGSTNPSPGRVRLRNNMTCF